MLEMTLRLALHCITVLGQVQTALACSHEIPMAGAWHTLLQSLHHYVVTASLRRHVHSLLHNLQLIGLTHQPTIACLSCSSCQLHNTLWSGNKRCTAIKPTLIHKPLSAEPFITSQQQDMMDISFMLVQPPVPESVILLQAWSSCSCPSPS